jgi:hypothetical protein
MPARSTAAPAALRAPSNRAAAARANQERQAALRFNSTSAAEQQRLWEQATSSLRGRSAPAPAPSAALTSPRTRSLAEDPEVESGGDAKVSSAPAQIPDDAIEAEVLRILIDGDAALESLDARNTSSGSSLAADGKSDGGAPRMLRFAVLPSARRGRGGDPDDEDEGDDSSDGDDQDGGNDAGGGAADDDLAARLLALLRGQPATARRAPAAGSAYMESPAGMDDLTDYALAGQSTAVKGCQATRRDWTPELYMRSTVLASTIDHLLAGRVDDALQNVLREYFALMLVHEGKGSREAWKAYKAVLPADLRGTGRIAPSLQASLESTLRTAQRFAALTAPADRPSNSRRRAYAPTYQQRTYYGARRHGPDDGDGRARARDNAWAPRGRQRQDDNYDRGGHDDRRAPARRFSRPRSASRRTIRRDDFERRSDSDRDDAPRGRRGGGR